MDAPLLMNPLSDALKETTKVAFQEVAPQLIGEALEQHLPEIIRRAALPVFMDKKQLMAMTGWSSRKVDYMRSRRQIPFIRRGRTILFLTADVEKYLMEGYVPAKEVDGVGE